MGEADGDVPAYEVRLARIGEEDAICAVCREGFAASSEGLLSPATIGRQSALYYEPARVRREIATAGDRREWQGYVVAVTASGQVVGAAGGGMAGPTVGLVLVLYLDLALRGRGIGSALLDFVTTQQRETGATEQWVTVTEGNELGLPFYRARGFVARERFPHFVADDGTVEAHALRMSRPL
ncbi:GNAT family N-acetyltransferase [Nocardioides caldifontis]|uniref:GNAT family N-acetyltransferase n=1 Tax=Nocardioides caldifontis TaxID=2588938 RepID=UPI0013969CF9|nr:GNAT family N-acetyltransferase [Nocardioides caldifontis]